MRLCTRCKQMRGVDAFALNRSRASGYQAWCRECARGYEQQAKAQPALPEGLPKWLTGRLA